MKDDSPPAPWISRGLSVDAQTIHFNGWYRMVYQATLQWIQIQIQTKGVLMKCANQAPLDFSSYFRLFVHKLFNLHLRFESFKNESLIQKICGYWKCYEITVHIATGYNILT